MVRARVCVPSQFLARALSRSGEAELLGPADRMDILDLIHTFGWCIDSAAYDVLATIITEDFSLDRSEGVIEGRDEFVEYLKKNAASHDYFRHQNHNPLMRSIDLSHAVAVSYLVMARVAPSKDAAGTITFDDAAHGVCVDHLKKEKEIWKLQRRTIDQMGLSAIMPANSEARMKFALTAGERQS